MNGSIPCYPTPMNIGGGGVKEKRLGLGSRNEENEELRRGKGERGENTKHSAQKTKQNTVSKNPK